MKDPESSPKGKFSEIAHSYSQLSSLQQSAGQILIKKLKIIINGAKKRNNSSVISEYTKKLKYWEEFI